MKATARKVMPGPGIYTGLTLDEYHSAGVCPGPAVSSSGLRKLWKTSPAHFYCEWAENPNAEPREETKSMKLGTAAHHFLLGEDDAFNPRYIMHPDKMPDAQGVMKPWSLQLKSAKQWKEEQEASGKTVISRDELEVIRHIANALKAHPLIDNGLLNGAIEQSMCVQDKETGLWLKVRPDAVPFDSGDYADLKSISDALDVTLKMTLRNYGYQQQGALQWEVCELLGIAFESWTLVFTETGLPYCVRIVALDDAELSRGRRQNRAMLRLIADCMDRGHWPGPGNENDAETFWLSKEDQEHIDKRLERYGA